MHGGCEGMRDVVRVYGWWICMCGMVMVRDVWQCR